MQKSIYSISILTLALTISLSCNFKSASVNAKTLYQASDEVAEYTNKSEVKASHILVDTKEEAEKLRQEILAGEDFEKIAQKYSKCPSGKQGGDLGYFRKGMMVPSFEKAAFSLPVGELSEPVKTQFGWHLIVVTGQR